MRGQQTLFNNLQEQLQPSSSNEVRKGRSMIRDAQRNECLVDRYYYLFSFTSDRYSVIIEKLEGQFFLSAARIINVLNENYDSLQRLKKESPPKSYFQKKYPHLVW